MAGTSIGVRRPVILKAVNGLGALLERAGLSLTLDSGAILDRAERVSGHTVHDPALREGLDRLVRSLEHEARLCTFGRFAIRRTLQRAAESRYRVERAFAEAPSIADEPIPDPVFIIGMPRTGTTILHALLHLDRNHRAPLSWECLLPHPAPRPEDYRDNDRIDTIRAEFERIFRLVPDLFALPGLPRLVGTTEGEARTIGTAEERWRVDRRWMSSSTSSEMRTRPFWTRTRASMRRARWTATSTSSTCCR